MRRQAKTTAPIARALEPRMMFDAAAPVTVAAAQEAAAAAEPAHDDAAQQFATQQEQLAAAAGQPAPGGTPAQVMFVDGGVANVEDLVKAAPADIAVVVLDPAGNGVQQITSYLESHQGLQSIHLVSHGNQGQITLGRDILSDLTLSSYGDQLQQWGRTLAPGADLLLYGCDVAQGETGRHFITELGSLTGTDVAASTDTTGAAALGGNWTLEARTGIVDTAAIDLGSLGWSGELASPVVYYGTGYQLFGGNQNSSDSSQIAIFDDRDNFGWVISSVKLNTSTVSFTASANSTAADGTFALDNQQGNDITGTLTFIGSFKDATGATQTGTFNLLGHLSRNEKANGIVQSLYFWTDTNNVASYRALGFEMVVPGKESVYTAQGSNFKVSTSADNQFLGEVNALLATQKLNAAAISVGADTATVAYGGTLNVASGSGLLSNDLDPNYPLTVSDVCAGTGTPLGNVGTSIAGTYGHLTVAANGSYTYVADAGTLANGQSGTDTFTYRANDGYGGVKTSTLTITVNNGVVANQAPVAQADKTVTVFEDSSANALSIAAPTDADGHSMTITVTGLPTGGTVKKADGTTVTANATLTSAELTGLTYTPTADLAGAGGTFSYSVSDGNGGTASQTVTLSVTGINDAPAFTLGANRTVNEDAGAQTVAGFASGMAKGGGADEAGQTLTFTTTNNNTALFSVQPSIAADGTLTYTPAANANGTATVTVTLADDGGTANGGVASTSRTFTITVTPVNDAPVVQADKTLTVLEDSTGNALGITAPTDVDTGDTLTITVTGLPTGGVIKKADGSTVTANATLTGAELAGLTFTPTADLSGTGGSFAYSVNDGTTTVSQTVTLAITPINDAPAFTLGANRTVNEDAGAQTVAGFASGMAKGGGADEAGQTLTFTTTNNNTALFSVQPSIAADGTLTYTPAANAHGTATVTVTLADDGGTANSGVASTSRTFTITVNPVNDAPVVQADKTLAVSDAGGNRALGITAPSDVDGDTLTITITGLPTHGTVKLADGTAVTNGQTLTSAQLTGLVYTPEAGYAGAAGTFTYSVTDGTATVGQTVTFTASANHAPVVQADKTLTVFEDSSGNTLGITAPTDVDGDSLTITVTGLPTGGTVKKADGSTVTANATLTGAELAGLTFTPTADLSGAGGTFAYSVNDGTTTVSQTVTLAITPINDAPVFTLGANRTVNEDAGAQTVAGFASGIGKGGGADEAGQTLTFTTTNNNNALFSVQPSIAADGTLTYTPAANAHGTATVTVTLADDGGTANGGVASTSRTFTITVNPVNDAPVVQADKTVTVLEDSTANALGITAPTDVDTGDSLTITVTGLPTGGVIRKADGTAVTNGQTLTGAELAGLTFTPTADLNGAGGTFTYSVGDGTVTTTRTVTLAITPVNDAPVAQADKTLTAQGGGGAIDLGITTPTDVDGDTLTITVTALPANGRITLADGTAVTLNQTLTAAQLTGLKFEPAAAGGSASFGYSVSDGQATVSRTIALEVAKVDTGARSVDTGSSKADPIVNSSPPPTTSTSSPIVNQAPVIAPVVVQPPPVDTAPPALSNFGNQTANAPVAMTFNGDGNGSFVQVSNNLEVNVASAASSSTTTGNKTEIQSFTVAAKELASGGAGGTINLRVEAGLPKWMKVEGQGDGTLKMVGERPAGDNTAYQVIVKVKRSNGEEANVVLVVKPTKVTEAENGQPPAQRAPAPARTGALPPADRLAGESGWLAEFVAALTGEPAQPAVPGTAMGGLEFLDQFAADAAAKDARARELAA